MKTSNDKSKKNDELKPQEKPLNVSKGSKAVKKTPKSKKPKEINDAVKNSVAVEAKETAKNLTAADIAKIEKKKAKKQAQKVKKQLRKTAPETEEKKPKVETATKTAKKSNSASDVAEEKSPQKQDKNLDKKLDKKQEKKAKRKANDKSKDIEKRERDPAAEAATVFVGNLPINTKRVQIGRLFQPYGTVQSIRLRTAGGKQLFKHKQRKSAVSLNAYVVLESPQIAEKALALNGTEFKECHLRVTPAAKASAGPGPGGNEQSSNDADNKRTIFVGNLKYSATEQKLREIFSSCGEIDYIRCLQDGEKGCKGVAYVCFQKPDAVGLALELNETVLDDRPIHVERYLVKKLGAKQARDSVAATKSGPQTKSKNKQNSAGAKKRLDKKKLKENGKPAESTKVAANKKKSEYRGVKVDAIKKNKKPKKKTNNQMSALAKKIAPKTKT
ncbi:nucleolar protein 12 [Drosophila innubila]|uniref:nucleolar protein 12 n=1 Tax=Drosophila innubila TaxID=198719 RepID=UPI00148DE218|nr:nucleolar protein 12 [Drosophila innubila]